MNLTEFKARRAALAEPPHRAMCWQCHKAVNTCYCPMLRPFAAPLSFVILQTPNEARNTIATARMAHLSMTNSHLFVGNDFSDHSRVNALIADETHHNVILYPGLQATPLDTLFAEAKDPRPLQVWVLDGKWAQIPKMLRRSPNVRALPMVKFAPDRVSLFQIRKQPRPTYVSTIESIYIVIERFMRHHGINSTDHHALIEVFQYLVRQQQGFVRLDDSRHKRSRLRRAAKHQKSVTIDAL